MPRLEIFATAEDQEEFESMPETARWYITLFAGLFRIATGLNEDGTEMSREVMQDMTIMTTEGLRVPRILESYVKRTSYGKGCIARVPTNPTKEN